MSTDSRRVSWGKCAFSRKAEGGATDSKKKKIFIIRPGSTVENRILPP